MFLVESFMCSCIEIIVSGYSCLLYFGELVIAGWHWFVDCRLTDAFALFLLHPWF